MAGIKKAVEVSEMTAGKIFSAERLYIYSA